ncbi:MAG: hypothetical protein HYS02_00580 [Candidatus Staskawiczbacteria bacterium]|nr:hypothetical protein [Candidatus Staskawiczbacteria bacterium]
MVFLTGFDDPEHISQAIEAVSGTDYIVKSDVNINQIVSLVKEKLSIK